MDYQILQSDDVDELEEMVQSAFLDGWKCQGGVAVTYEGFNKTWYYQAMIKENN